ncbi:protocadherin gamma-C3-like [Protopterus annectens]|uniref:protocadherin gamma-C3-like n=1 Tax=Protopterus annectens TaxID=7888 RepID=UPI001CF9A5A2|nr:protocadherin gamma-C3-like [Protopterus annectens]
MESPVKVTWVVIFTSPFVFGQLRYTVPEEKDPGTYIGNVATDLSLDMKKMALRRFRIVSSAQGQHFDINPGSGRLLIKDRLDREQLCGTNLVCSLNFEVMLENPVELHHVEVNILDINDNAPSFRGNEIKLDISEATLPGVRFPVEKAYDPDIGTNSVSVYQLSPNKHFILKNPNPGEGNEFPELLLERALDREHEKTHLLTMTAYDGGYQQHSAVAKIIVNVLDANDNPPVFSQSQYVVTLEENASNGSLVIKLNATDLDEGTNAEIVYSYSASTAAKAHELFRLDSATGVITLNGSVDFEDTSRYELYILATNKGPRSEVALCKILVEIIDLNDNGPEISVTSVSHSIPEDAPTGTVVAFISVADKDSGPNGHVSCKISHNIPFQLKPSLNNYYTLVTSNALDRELVSEYNVSVWATDQGSPVRSSHRTIRVHIEDVNDNPPSFSETTFEIYVTENNFPGAAVGRVNAEDPDLGKNADISYIFVGNQLNNEPSSTCFSVGREDGVIYALTSLDYEKMREYQFRIKGLDAGIPQLSGAVNIKVYVIDANDNTPEILYPFPGKDLEGANSVPRSANAGHLVAKVLAVDADVGFNAWISYQLLKSDVSELFSISKYTGEIRTARQIQSNDSSVHNLVIMVKDNGRPSLSASTVIHLALTDSVPDARPKVNMPQTGGEESISDLNLYLIICLLSVLFLFFVVVSITVALRCYNSANMGLQSNFCSRWKTDTNSTYQQRNAFVQSHGSQGLQAYVEVHGGRSIYKVDTYRISVPQELKDDFITIDFPSANNSNPCHQQFQELCLLSEDNIGPILSSEVRKYTRLLSCSFICLSV